MPAWYKIDRKHKLVLSTGSGVVSAADLLAAQKKLSADPDFEPGFSHLVDFTHVKKLDVNENEIPGLAGGTPFSQSSRRAILVGTDSAHELSEMFRTLRETMGDRGTRTFRTLDEALDWLVRRMK